PLKFPKAALGNHGGFFHFESTLENDRLLEAMNVQQMFEAVVEYGKILISNGSSLSDRTKVFTLVPEASDRVAGVESPKLVDPVVGVDFKKTVISE
ncbi:MAG: hypothetical protein AAGA58_05925, partial [Verrucomicrobiota bacterium]